MTPFGFPQPRGETSPVFRVKSPINAAMPDGSVIHKIPDHGTRMRILKAYWEVTTPFVGGTTAAIGVSASNHALSTRGAILGGPTGDTAQALSAGFHAGTVGTALEDGEVAVLLPNDELRFDRIASAFTSGEGFVHLELVAVP